MNSQLAFSGVSYESLRSDSIFIEDENKVKIILSDGSIEILTKSLFIEVLIEHDNGHGTNLILNSDINVNLTRKIDGIHFELESTTILDINSREIETKTLVIHLAPLNKKMTNGRRYYSIDKQKRKSMAA